MIKLYNKTFLILFLTLLIIEVLLATIFANTIFRPVFGDYLVVILIYSFIRAITKLKRLTLGIAVLLFSYTLELFQLFKIRDQFPVLKSKILAIILGTSFDWFDILAYTLGVFTILIADPYILKLEKNSIKINQK